MIDRDDDAMVGTTELARRLGITDRTVYRLVEDGTLPYYRVGGVLRFDLGEVLGKFRRGARRAAPAVQQAAAS